jgi:hypothetical protein
MYNVCRPVKQINSHTQSRPKLIMYSFFLAGKYVMASPLQAGYKLAAYLPPCSSMFYVLCIHHGFCSLNLPCLYFSPKYSTYFYYFGFSACLFLFALNFYIYFRQLNFQRVSFEFHLISLLFVIQSQTQYTVY